MWQHFTQHSFVVCFPPCVLVFPVYWVISRRKIRRLNSWRRAGFITVSGNSSRKCWKSSTCFTSVLMLTLPLWLRRYLHVLAVTERSLYAPSPSFTHPFCPAVCAGIGLGTGPGQAPLSVYPKSSHSLISGLFIIKQPCRANSVLQSWKMATCTPTPRW